MAKKTSKPKAPAQGERAATGGYFAQYRLCAQGILSSLRNETLEWIRLADLTAGRVDDFQIGSSARVDAHQVKWSSNPGGFTFRDLTALDGGNPCLINQLADGWSRLKSINSNLRVVVHLVTNETPSASRLIDLVGEQTKGSFAEFLTEALNPFIESRNTIPVKWSGAWQILASLAGMTISDFEDFIVNCRLDFEVRMPEASPESQDHIYMRDLRTLTEFVQSVVADPAKVTELKRSELVGKLGWSKRITFASSHVFPDPLMHYEEIEYTADKLRMALQDYKSGYLALVGNPGAGKSTLLTKTLDSAPYRVFRYFAYVPDGGPNVLRGEATNFLHDMVLSFDRAGFRAGKSLNDTNDLRQLTERFHEQLEMLSEDARTTGRKTVIIVDGLDHIPREQKPVDSLLRHLPEPQNVPEGVVFILGTQTTDLDGLPSSIQNSVRSIQGRRIEIASLSTGAIRRVIERSLPDLPPDDVAEITRLSAGHPLALSLIVNRLTNLPPGELVKDALAESQLYEGKIDDLYFSLWTQILNDREGDRLAELFGIIVRLRPGIDLKWVATWASDPTVSRLRRKFYHLFYRESEFRWHFFHNSFRIFLIRQTAEVPPEGYSEAEDKRIHAHVAQLCGSSPDSSIWKWEVAYHLLQANDYDGMIANLNASSMRLQVTAFRPIENILEDLRFATTKACARKDFAKLAELLFLQAEFAARADRLSTVHFHKLLLTLGDIEGSLQYLRKGRNLVLGVAESLRACGQLLDAGCADDARSLFRIAEPIELLKGKKLDANQDSDSDSDVDSLLAWSEVVLEFRTLAEAVKLIRQVQLRDGEESHSDRELAIQNRLMFSIGRKLIDKDKWSELEQLLIELEGTQASGRFATIWLHFHAWKRLFAKGDRELAKQHVNRAREVFTFDDLTPDHRLILCEGSIRVLQDKVFATQLFTSIDREKLINGSNDDFERLYECFRYFRLSFALKLGARSSEMVPDAKEARDQGKVYVLRGLCEIGRLSSIAWDGNKLSGVAFVQEMGLLLRLFAKDMSSTDVRDQWHLLMQHKSKFYDLLVSVASQHGEDATHHLAQAFESEWQDRPNYWPTSVIRSVVAAFQKMRFDKNWCRKILSALEEQVPTDTTDSLVSWYSSQIGEWVSAGALDRAADTARDLLSLPPGIGYRKDYQLSSYISLLKRANEADPTKSGERFQLFQNAIVSMIDRTEGNAIAHVASLLLSAASEWNPVYSLNLARKLADRGAIPYLNAVASILDQLIASTDVPVSLIQWCITDILIPLSPNAYGDSIEKLVLAVASRGSDAASSTIADLDYAITVYAIPECRNEWRIGLKQSALALGLDATRIVEKIEVTTPDELDLYFSYKGKSGNILSRAELAAQIVDPSDLLTLMDDESEESTFNWFELVNNYAGVMDGELLTGVLEKLSGKKREIDPQIVIAKRLCDLGKSDEAWSVGCRLAKNLDRFGWYRHFDGGSVYKVFKLLRRLRPEEARTLAYAELEAIVAAGIHYPLDLVKELESLSEILTDDFPALKIWDSFETYLQGVTQYSDPPPQEIEVVLQARNGEEMLVALSVEFLGHLAHALSSASVQICSRLIWSGNKLAASQFARLLKSADVPRDVMIVLEAVAEKTHVPLMQFKNEIISLLRSTDQWVRWSAERLADQMQIPPLDRLEHIPTSENLDSFIVIPSKPAVVGTLPTSYDLMPDTDDPFEVFKIWIADFEFMSIASGKEVEELLVIAQRMMTGRFPRVSWRAKEDVFRERMEKLGLKFPYRRPRSEIAQQTIYRLIAALADASLISDYNLSMYSKILRNSDPSLVWEKPKIRPQEVKNANVPKYKQFDAEWVKAVRDGSFAEHCASVKGEFILAEKTVLKFAGNANAKEQRLSVVGASGMRSPSISDNNGFFSVALRKTRSDYYEDNGDYDESRFVIENEGYTFETPCKDWLAVNPRLAEALTWQLANEGDLFAWECNGTPIAWTTWWQDGLIDYPMPFYREGEIGHGYLVVCSEDGARQLQERCGPLIRTVRVIRSIDVERQPYQLSYQFQEPVAIA